MLRRKKKIDFFLVWGGGFFGFFLGLLVCFSFLFLVFGGFFSLFYFIKGRRSKKAHTHKNRVLLKCIDLSCRVIHIIKDSSLGGGLLLADKAFWKGHVHGQLLPAVLHSTAA